MYEKRTFYIAESITVKDLLSLLSNVAERFNIESVIQQEMIDSLKSAIKRAKEHAFALYHSVNQRNKDGNYFEFGFMNVEGLGIIAALEFDASEEHRGPSLISLDLKIDGFVLNSTVPSWQSKFHGEEQKRIFNDFETLITSELVKIPVNIREIVSKSEWELNNSKCWVFYLAFFWFFETIKIYFFWFF